MIGLLFANLSFTSMYRMSVISATNVYFCVETKKIKQYMVNIFLAVYICVYIM